MSYNDIEFIDFQNKHSISCWRKEFTGKNEHRHAYYEIELVVKGKGKHRINGHDYDESIGDICIMRLTDSHELEMTEPGEHWSIEIPSATIPEDIIRLMNLTENDIITHLDKNDFERAKELYLMLEECNDKNDVFSETQKMHLACTVILFVIQKTEKNFAQKYSQQSIRIREIVEYIQNNLFEDLSMTRIAEHFFITKEYLSTFFKKNMGISLVEYIRKIRLSYAAKLVVTTNKKMIDICEMSGFNSLPTFMRAFRGEFGLTPTEMRKKYMMQNKD